MPTDHPRVSFTNVWVPDDAIFGPKEWPGGRAGFVHENRIRQAASSLGAATFCVNESVKYARERKPFGRNWRRNQGIQFPLVELATQCEMLRLLIRKTAWEMDQMPHPEVEKKLSDKVSMCNYWANRWCARRPTGRCRCTAASATRATSRSSTSTATTAATASPRARRRSRCARWPAYLFG
jgi:acyl-CoA dehydrogenase